MPSPSDGQFDSGFLRSLYGPLMEEARAQVELALRVAVLLNQEVPRAEIAERLNVSAGDVRAAVQRLRDIAPALERE